MSVAQRRTRPLPFIAPLVLAIKRETEAPGTGKTQTRRLLKKVPPMPEPNCHPEHKQKHPAPYLDAYCSEPKTPWNPRGMSDNWCWWQVDDRCCGDQFNVGYRPGDIGWVKETYAYPNDQVTIYRADWRENALARGLDNVPETDEGIAWKSARFMPKRDSRFVLEITNVRVQRLQDITEEDAQAEGPPLEAGNRLHATYRIAFANLWDSIHGPGAWDENPWVVALTFQPHAINVLRFQDIITRWAA